MSVCSVDFCMPVWFGRLGAGVVHVGGALTTTIFSFRKSTVFHRCFTYSLFMYSPFYFVFFCFPNKVLCLGILCYLNLVFDLITLFK